MPRCKGEAGHGPANGSDGARHGVQCREDTQAAVGSHEGVVHRWRWEGEIHHLRGGNDGSVQGMMTPHILNLWLAVLRGCRRACESIQLNVR